VGDDAEAKEVIVVKIKKFDQINVLPFIDIMLVLLVIVLTSASFVSKSEIPIDLPQGKGESASTEPMKYIIIDQTGVLYFENHKMTFEALQKKILSLNPKTERLVIRSDAKSQFQNFVKVIDLLKSHGFKQVSIETKE